VYVKADMNVYAFYKSQDSNIINDAADFTGANSCYLFNSQENTDIQWKF